VGLVLGLETEDTWMKLEVQHAGLVRGTRDVCWLLRWLLACCIGLNKRAGFCAWAGVICRRCLMWVSYHCLQRDNQLGQRCWCRSDRSGAFKPPHRRISKTVTGFGGISDVGSSPLDWIVLFLMT
jgi:hypothetical protein